VRGVGIGAWAGTQRLETLVVIGFQITPQRGHAIALALRARNGVGACGDFAQQGFLAPFVLRLSLRMLRAGPSSFGYRSGCSGQALCRAGCDGLGNQSIAKQRDLGGEVAGLCLGGIFRGHGATPERILSSVLRIAASTRLPRLHLCGFRSAVRALRPFVPSTGSGQALRLSLRMLRAGPSTSSGQAFRSGCTLRLRSGCTLGSLPSARGNAGDRLGRSRPGSSTAFWPRQGWSAACSKVRGASRGPVFSPSGSSEGELASW